MRHADRAPPPQQMCMQAAAGTLEAMQQPHQAGSPIKRAEMHVLTQAGVQAGMLARIQAAGHVPVSSAPRDHVASFVGLGPQCGLMHAVYGTA